VQARLQPEPQVYKHSRRVGRTFAASITICNLSILSARTDYGMNGPALRPPSNSRNHRYIDRGPDTKMRNVIFAINITLDGCCDHTKQIGDEETEKGDGCWKVLACGRDCN